MNGTKNQKSIESRWRGTNYLALSITSFNKKALYHIHEDDYVKSL